MRGYLSIIDELKEIYSTLRFCEVYKKQFFPLEVLREESIGYILNDLNVIVTQADEHFFLYSFDCESIEDARKTFNAFVEYQNNESMKLLDEQQGFVDTSPQESETSLSLYVGKSQGDLIDCIKAHIGFYPDERKLSGLKLSQWIGRDDLKKIPIKLSIYRVEHPENVEVQHKLTHSLYEEALRRIKKPVLGR